MEKRSTWVCFGASDHILAGLNLTSALTAASAEDQRVNFDIPDEGFAEAIYRYSSVKGVEVLVPKDLLAHRRSAAIIGTFAPEDALRPARPNFLLSNR